MIKSLKTISLIFFILFAATNVFSQTDSRDVSITASGSGKTQEEAKQAALRSATEQAFGAFISSKTEMFNDQVVADEMASVSSGNIKTFSILNESQLPNGSWGVTLKALISVDKLTSFVEAKGIAIEIKGGMFALKIKQQLLNEQSEIKAVSEMVGLLHESMQISFDYVIRSGEPKSLDAESKNWEIPLVVTATANKNMAFCASYCIKTLAALSLSREEAIISESLNKAVFPVVINYDEVPQVFFLRKKSSMDALNTLTSNWEFYTRLFKVQSGMDESNGSGEGQIHVFSKYENRFNFINFLTAGQQAATFSWQDKRTLSQIEQMTGYRVKPRGVVSQFKHGGFVVYEIPSGYYIGAQMDTRNLVVLTGPGSIAEKAGLTRGDKIISINEINVIQGNVLEVINKSIKENKLCEFKIERQGRILKLDIYPAYVTRYGLVAAITDLESMDWNTAKTACDELKLNGYSDWHLPSKEELNALYVDLKQLGVGGFVDFVDNNVYWSSTKYTESNASSGFVWQQHFIDGRQDFGWQKAKAKVRAVRAF
jgi:hypothetical protein